jgi:hypothetical protein
MIVKPFPLPPPNYQPGFLTRTLESLRGTLRSAVSKDEAVDGILLQSPDGSVWKVTVDNAGSLVTTQVPLGR